MLGSETIDTCAACGKEGSDGLKACAACFMVKYCNRDCQIAHRPQHKKECKKRAAEIYDEALFKEVEPQGAQSVYYFYHRMQANWVFNHVVVNSFAMVVFMQ